jgi:hypothetical protein
MAAVLFGVADVHGVGAVAYGGAVYDIVVDERGAVE